MSSHHPQVWVPGPCASDWPLLPWLTYRCWPGMGLIAFFYPLATTEHSGVLGTCWSYGREMNWGLHSGALYRVVWPLSLQCSRKGLRA